ncbi:unnamed protein product [Adineta steineri]|uniref:Pentapeptide repeat-containing protein n=1 Tax=Adineta steineri TaxID=433720 RepID=A0A815QN60_9BILA|nr:unnamed protein product [Adineta steineri]CAF1465742.1 unnamed protein product [Adineta steineri]
MLKNIFHRKYLNHSFSDWISLISNLFIPLIIGILAIVLPLQQEDLNEDHIEHSRISAFNHRLTSMESLHDQQQQIILNTYQQDLTNLIFKYNLFKNSTDKRISLIIRTKTFHTLRQLDPIRKVFLRQLLIDSGIQYRINISYTDLSSLIFPQGSFYNQLKFTNIQAENLLLKNIYLYQSNFSYSILDNSLFLDSNCSYADFSYTSLQKTDWTNTDVTQIIFNYTNLYGAKITQEQLDKVQSLQGAILPNGSTVVG